MDRVTFRWSWCLKSQPLGTGWTTVALCVRPLGPVARVGGVRLAAGAAMSHGGRPRCESTGSRSGPPSLPMTRTSSIRNRIHRPALSLISSLVPFLIMNGAVPSESPSLVCVPVSSAWGCAARGVCEWAHSTKWNKFRLHRWCWTSQDMF